jgi:hypothetical protein
MSALHEVQERLNDSWSVLAGQWQVAREVWLDAVRDDFERSYWQEIEETTLVTVAALRRLAEVIESARRRLE